MRATARGDKGRRRWWKQALALNSARGSSDRNGRGRVFHRPSRFKYNHENYDYYVADHHRSLCIAERIDNVTRQRIPFAEHIGLSRTKPKPCTYSSG
jgi:hypothetical protein